MYNSAEENDMNPWICALLIAVAGAFGSVVNALLTDNGFALPRKESGVWCPGVISNILVGAFAAFASWAFYGSGAAIELATAEGSPRTLISLRFSALAGAFLVGVAGSKWITNEVDKRLLKESTKVAASKTLPAKQSEEIMKGSPRQVLHDMKEACDGCP
jgi:hypothetical protein